MSLKDVRGVVRAAKILQNRQTAYKGNSQLVLNNAPNPNVPIEPTNKLVTPVSLTKIINHRGFEFGDWPFLVVRNLS